MVQPHQVRYQVRYDDRTNSYRVCNKDAIARSLMNDVLMHYHAVFVLYASTALTYLLVMSLSCALCLQKHGVPVRARMYV